MDWVNLIVFAYGYFGSKICETFASTLYLLFHITMTFFTLMVEKVLTFNWLFSDDIFDSADCSINDIVSIHNAEIGADAFFSEDTFIPWDTTFEEVTDKTILVCPIDWSAHRVLQRHLEIGCVKFASTCNSLQ